MDTSKLWRRFLQQDSLVLLVFALGLAVGLFIRNNQLISNMIEDRATSHFRNIVLAREWNAGYGGVFVEKTEGMESNPYLENPDILSVDGQTYTKKNPALMTREISELAIADSLYSFHITSLNPLNPGNNPDSFEEQALLQFEEGVGAAQTKVYEGDRTYYRYMGPLVTEESCLQCHAQQGYQVGDIRGGISVLFDITEIEDNLRSNNIFIFIFCIISVLILIGLTYIFVRGLMQRLNTANKEIREMAITDSLTKLYNRRYFFTQLRDEFLRIKRHKRNLSCIMLDIDFFKKFNDTYGHQTGDVVLREVAKVVNDQARATDLVARYGGEEFVVMLPETDEKGAAVFGEKIRGAVESKVMEADDGTQLKVTVSVGVCAMTTDEIVKIEDESLIIKFADKALYTAKENGRNRVELYRNGSPDMKD